MCPRKLLIHGEAVVVGSMHAPHDWSVIGSGCDSGGPLERLCSWCSLVGTAVRRMVKCQKPKIFIFNGCKYDLV